VRSFAKEALECLGYTVIAASSGEEALERLQSAPAGVDLLLTDIALPGAYDGRELASLVRASQPGLPVICMSGHAARQHHQEESACDAFLEKPFTPGTLATTIRLVLRGRGDGGAVRQ